MPIGCNSQDAARRVRLPFYFELLEIPKAGADINQCAVFSDQSDGFIRKSLDQPVLLRGYNEGSRQIRSLARKERASWPAYVAVMNPFIHPVQRSLMEASSAPFGMSIQILLWRSNALVSCLTAHEPARTHARVLLHPRPRNAPSSMRMHPGDSTVMPCPWSLPGLLR